MNVMQLFFEHLLQNEMLPKAKQLIIENCAQTIQ